jgi:uncharacterized protein YjbI with pentapeptide repeats
VAREEHIQVIREGVEAWNDWREWDPKLQPDLNRAKLSDANLSGANLSGANLNRAKLSGAKLSDANLSGASLDWANLSGARLRGADLSDANLWGANLSGADLSGANLSDANLDGANLLEASLWDANLSGANLDRANLSGANLSGANLSGANLNWANLRGANLSKANFNWANLGEAILSAAQLIKTNLCGATLTGSRVYGASVWDIEVNDQTNQQNLVITPAEDAAITVDNIKVAQFIYLLLNNKEIRNVIDTITSKAVLILGRFSDERKPVLDAIREELRKSEHNYLPIVFDFHPSANRTTGETIKTLAGMARFVIADLTDARSVLEELALTIPTLPTVAVRFLIKKSEPQYGMLDYFRAYKSVIETHEYESLEELIASIKENIIEPAEAKVKELRLRS